MLLRFQNLQKSVVKALEFGISTISPTSSPYTVPLNHLPQQHHLLGDGGLEDLPPGFDRDRMMEVLKIKEQANDAAVKKCEKATGAKCQRCFFVMFFFPTALFCLIYSKKYVLFMCVVQFSYWKKTHVPLVGSSLIFSNSRLFCSCIMFDSFVP